jgi:hypothetical protein
MIPNDQKPLIDAYAELCPIMDKLYDQSVKAVREGRDVPEYEEIRHMIHEVTTRCAELAYGKPLEWMDPIVIGWDNRRKEVDRSGYESRSDAPCCKCGKMEVWIHEIDEIHGDIRWKCFGCESTGIEEGPDY